MVYTVEVSHRSQIIFLYHNILNARFSNVGKHGQIYCMRSDCIYIYILYVYMYMYSYIIYTYM